MYTDFNIFSLLEQEIYGACEVLTRPEVRCTHCGWARG